MSARHNPARRLWISGQATLILILALAACTTPAEPPATTPTAGKTSAPGPASATPPEQPARIEVAHDNILGPHLVDARGQTIYIFTEDEPDQSTCTGECAASWPPVLTVGDPIAGEGVDATLLGTTRRPDGTMQVTYNGRPLYTFILDKRPGDATGQGIGDVWFAISPDGGKIVVD